MNQDELLERMWIEVIDSVDEIAPLDVKAEIPLLDVRHVARSTRYEVLFAWCQSFDEEGLSVADWLALPTTDPRWKGLAACSASTLTKRPRAPRPDAPFADAVNAELRLRDARVTPAQLAKLMTREGIAAVTGLRALLASTTFEQGELEGLHEALLSADPSGSEARPGSWPRATKRVATAAPSAGPLLALSKSHALAFSPDGRRIVAAKDGAITDVASGAKLATCKLLANTSNVTWSPDGRSIAAASTSGHIALCDAETGARLHVLERAKEGPAPVFSADGTALFGGDWSGALHAWDVRTGRVLAELRLGSVMIRRVELTPRGNLVVLVSHRPTPNELVHLSRRLEEKARVLLPEFLEDFAIDPRSDDRAIACGRDWVAPLDLTNGAVGTRHACAAKHVALSPDGNWCALTTATGFRVGASSDLARATDLSREYASGRAAFSADSKRIALGTWNAGEVWELASIPQPGSGAAPRRSST